LPFLTFLPKIVSGKPDTPAPLIAIMMTGAYSQRFDDPLPMRVSAEREQ
jgi:hypothetical protein